MTVVIEGETRTAKVYMGMLGVAVIFVSQHIRCRSSICSHAFSVLHLYLFRCTFNVAVVIVPLVCLLNKSK